MIKVNDCNEDGMTAARPHSCSAFCLFRKSAVEPAVTDALIDQLVLSLIELDQCQMC